MGVDGMVMSNVISQAVASGIQAAADAAANDWRVSAGMIAAGVALGVLGTVGGYLWRKRKVLI